MTWLAILLKPILGPVMQFIALLVARWVAIAFYRLIPDGRVRRALFDKTLLDRRTWIQPTIVLALIPFMFLIWYLHD